MKRFGTFILNGRWQAGSMAFLFAILPLLNWLSLVIVALVTLRKGRSDGASVLLCALLPAIGFAFFGHSVVPLLNGVLSAILIWILAQILRDRANWTDVLIVGASIGVAVVLVMHAYSDDLGQWWQQMMLGNMQLVNTEVAMDATTQQQILKNLVPIATGIIAALALLMSLGWLVLARNWQAALFNPGQLRPELHAIRMPKWAALSIIVLVLLAVLTRWPVVIDFLPVALLPFALAGLSIVHFIVATRKLSWVWLILFYVLLVLFLPYLGSCLVVLALLDSGLNLRVRIAAPRE